MHNYAHIDTDTNTVINIVIGGQEFAQEDPAHWKRCTFLPEEKKRDANIGDMYDPVLDIFTMPKPYPSWVLSEDKFSWVAPVPFPTEVGEYSWDEAQLNWKLEV